jgi:aryl-alcohol dehydrogenase-like predicted oxidoreductase
VEYRRLGQTSLELSRIGLGCGNFGGIGSAPELFGRGESEEEAFALMDTAWAAGVNFFDTAASYGGGRSETWVGRWRRDRGADIVLSTKVYWSVTGDPDDRGLARERVLRENAGSLGRLGVDRVQMYLTHEADPETPILETLEALDQLVQDGKVEAIGASNISAEQLLEAVETSDTHGLARYAWVQNELNLLAPDAQDDVRAICRREGLGFTPFSPLAGGWLTGKYIRGAPYPAGSRMSLRPEPYQQLVAVQTFRALDSFRTVADELETEPATLALAWLLAQPDVTAVVVGPRNAEHLRSALAALELDLDENRRDELASLFR